MLIDYLRYSISHMKKIIYPFLIIVLAVLWIFPSCNNPDTSNLILKDSVSIAAGGKLFHQNCSGCHNFKQFGIGPNLTNITETDSLGWLRKFIRDPKSVLASGDAHAKSILADYHTLMPSFTTLKEEELDQLIAFLNTKKGKTTKADPNAIKNPVPGQIPASNIEIPLQLFAQVAASSDKEPHTRISKMDWLPSSKAWFILDQRGKIYKLSGEIIQPWLDISKWKPAFINQPGLATGLGSFAFHPNYAANHLLYTTHCEAAHTKKADFAIPDSIPQTLQWVLCEWKVSDPDAPILNGTCRELLRIDMVSGIHGVQEIIFNPRVKPGNDDYGMLYIGVGDGGSVENGHAFLTHHPDHIWGSILRIDPLGKNSANGQYGIPSRNPFVKTAGAGIVREIYADGFRNPNRITWTDQGEMLSTNIGQANIEAIDIVLKGHDYGWPIREGRFLMHPMGEINNLFPLPADDSLYHITYPSAVFDHDEGLAIAGGFEYEGRDIPQLKGKYLFGDIPSGRLFFVNTKDLGLNTTAPISEWFVSLNGKRQTLREICGQERVDLRFAKDANGEMFIFTKPDGKIYRLINGRNTQIH